MQSDGKENDIALIRVKVPFNFSDKSIAAISLPDIRVGNDYPGHGMNVTAVGWGRTPVSEY